MTCPTCGSSKAFHDMPDDDVQTIVHALRVAADRYREDAESLRTDAGGPHDRLIAQFKRQQADANALADRIDGIESPYEALATRLTDAVMERLKSQPHPVIDVEEVEREFAAPCDHDWQEQPGEPPIDVCSSCGAVRE